MWREKIQITLNQDEIFAALDAYVREQISVKDGMEVAIDMKAGRGENGYSATIDIVPAGTAKATPVAPVASAPAAATPVKTSNPFAKPSQATAPVSAPVTPAEEPEAQISANPEDRQDPNQEAETVSEATPETEAAPVKPKSIFSKVTTPTE